MGVVAWGVALVGGLLVLKVGLGILGSRAADDTLTGVALVTAVGLIALVMADTAYAVFENTREPGDRMAAASYARESDPALWYGEAYPRTYYPSAKAFVHFKPMVSLAASTYGEFYEPAMLDSPTLADSVLDWRRIDYTIDELGFRDPTPPNESSMFALGDSFVFGYATADGDHWVDKLETLSGESIYNMGISGTGPRWQLQSLTALLANPSVEPPARVIWMLFEGNDLENSYSEERSPLETPSRLRRLITGTLLEFISTVPETIKSQSLITKFRAMLSAPPASPIDPAYFVTDGIATSVPLFRSAVLGPRMFAPDDVERAIQPEAYVLGHGNRPALDATLADMKSLSVQFNFAVTVMVAPSAARLHGPQFDGFPELSERPYFIEYVNAQAASHGFEVFDLLGALRPVAERELLYFRDDHHWNVRGNDVVAEILADGLGLRPE